ncbi:MAG: GGDEF domain-containing protein [Candidatus Omnitrophica bacterium]|nr:GGDEF domain-containing protein [Candidatus Omnitrophota bacterium]
MRLVAMLLVMLCWALAMLSGLCWARQYTALLTGATVLAVMWTHPFPVTGWAEWLRLAALVVTPWLLAAQRVREQMALKQLHAEEAVQMSQLSDAARALLSLQTATQQMERQITEITDLYHVTKETVRAMHLHELFAASLNIAPRLLDARGLRLVDLSGQSLRVLRATRSADGRMAPPPVCPPEAGSHGNPPDHGLPLGSPRTGGGGANTALDFEQAVVRQAVALGKPASATAQELACALPEGIARLSWAPLLREQQPVGVLIADDLPEEQLRTLMIVANQLSLQFSRILLYQQVEALAVTDALTGLSVRGYFLERAREELARSKRHGLSCTLLMADLDLFKQKNDTFGHLVGDVVLKEVARLLSDNLREIDLIARFGGEEFIMLLIETSVDQGMPITQRLKQLVEVHPIRAYDELLTQTISIGVAGFPDHGDTLETLIERADQALYAAKRAGRNQVVLWTEKSTLV